MVLTLILKAHKVKGVSIIVSTHSRAEWSKTTDSWVLNSVTQLERKLERKSEEQWRDKQWCGTLNGVAESGFIWTIGAIRTTPAKSLGLSQAVRMEIAPP